MPWTAADAESHHKGLTASQREQWAEVANAVRLKLLSQGKSESEADAEAVKQANEAVEKKPPEGAKRTTKELTVPNTLKESLQEYTDNRGVKPRVDRATGVIYGVKILGTESVNKRDYPDATLREAKGLYEGSRVFVNHAPNPGEVRGYQEGMGRLQNIVQQPGSGLFADHHFNPKHSLAEQYCWDAENDPAAVGFSHNVNADTRMDGDRKIVEAITEVVSVDLVSRPATTNGLFEHKETAVTKTIKQIRESLKAGSLNRRILEDMDGATAVEIAPGGTPDEESEKALMSMVTALIRNRELDDDTKVSRFKILLGLQKPPEVKPDEEETAATESLRKENKSLTEQVEHFKVEKRVDQLLTESKLPDRLRTATFRRQLIEAKDEQSRKDLIEDRKILVTESGGYPQSREQILESEPTAEKSGFDQGKAYADQRAAQLASAKR